MDEKETVRKMLSQLLSVTIASARAQFQVGADIEVMADHATGNLVSPCHYQDFLFPYHKILTLEENVLRRSVKVMIGETSISATFAEKIGADGYGRDAGKAVQVARSFM